ncbi:hypothetical protein FRC12_002498 [Ceratobasidium sp. 428]|nr:hypothetical protein FRC12_002498 [Ceratobasidium sp. 428]
MHDVESLLWILVWVVAHHSRDKKTWKINDTAKELISDLSQNNYRQLAKDKELLLSNRRRLVTTISGLDNDWSKDLLPVIEALANFIHAYLYVQPEPPKATRKSTNPQGFNPSIVLADPTVGNSVEPHRTYTNEPRLHTYARLLNIFTEEIATLEETYPSIDLSRM